MGRSRSVAFAIARDLREQILAGTRAPGSVIVEQRIAEAHGVSRTPVREAVLRLADEGLIDVFPQSGTFVSRIPIDELSEAIAIRRALEEATVRMAARLATADDIAALRAMLEQQRRLGEGSDQAAFQQAAFHQAAFHQADELFHATLARIARQERFWSLVVQVKLQVDRFRRLTLPVPGRMAAVVEEHAAIVEALAAGAPEAAAAALAAHLEFLLNAVGSANRAHPELFATSNAFAPATEILRSGETA